MTHLDQLWLNQPSTEDYVLEGDGFAVSPAAVLRRERISTASTVGIFQQLVDGLAEQAALIDLEDWTILAVNRAWARTTTLNGYADFKPGANYFEEIAKVAAAGLDQALPVLQALREMRQKRRESLRLVYEGTGLQQGLKFETRLSTIEVGASAYLIVTRYDITELVHLRELRNDFSVSVMQAQEGERRRMGRELHDSGLQLLAGLSLSLARLKLAKSEAEVAAVTADMEALLFEGQREFRAISFLAHPPQLDSLAFGQALRTLVVGFGERAGLKTTCEIEGALPGLAAEVEHTLYRVVQEAISNVHRHAAASTLTVRVVTRARMLHALVVDDGRGIPSDLRHGVGLLGMRDRLRERGGRLTIATAAPGTAIIASLPLATGTAPGS